MGHRRNSLIAKSPDGGWFEVMIWPDGVPVNTGASSVDGLIRGVARLRRRVHRGDKWLVVVRQRRGFFRELLLRPKRPLNRFGPFDRETADRELVRIGAEINRGGWPTNTR